ncbi:MAG: hypothetical protein QGE95_16845, partial [Arenicellales bacterium]|nr:hypothetical protein [Arenicellales bacterium]
MSVGTINALSREICNQKPHCNSILQVYSCTIVTLRILLLFRHHSGQRFFSAPFSTLKAQKIDSSGY